MGMDVHQDSIAVAVAEADGTERPSGPIPNRPEALRRLVRRLGGPAAFAYEAGPRGYAVYRQLQALGHACLVAVPGLVPRKPGGPGHDRSPGCAQAGTQSAGR